MHNGDCPKRFSGDTMIHSLNFLVFLIIQHLLNPKNVACIVPVDPIFENSDANWISYVFWVTEKDKNLLEIGSWHKTSVPQSSYQIIQKGGRNIMYAFAVLMNHNRK